MNILYRVIWCRIKLPNFISVVLSLVSTFACGANNGENNDASERFLSEVCIRRYGSYNEREV